MYNQSQKSKFIMSKDITIKTAAFYEQIFRWFEPYENKWGTDLTMQPANVLQPVINELSGVRKKSGLLVYATLKDYARWSKEQGYQVDDGIFHIEIDTKKKIKKQMVASPSDLYELMRKRIVSYKGKQYEQGFDSPEKETVDITYRTFLWMAFSGLKDTDAIRIKSDNVNLQNRRIYYDNNIYPIYEDSLRDFEKACSLNRFLYEHPHYSTFVSRAQGDLILRGLRSPTPDLKTIRPVINKRLCANDSKEKISYNRIYLSGMFYRLYLRESMGVPVDFFPIVEREMKGKTYSQSPTRTLNTIANRYCLELNEDYIEWKETFYPKSE